MFNRVLTNHLPHAQSIFLWGARQTGKSTFLQHVFPLATYYDLLKTDELIRLSGQPELLREEVLALSAEQLNQPIIIDEIQKIPSLLNEVHWLIEHTQAYFILCGSSARKLRLKGVNLLGGRAWPFYFFPLVCQEVPDFDLLKVLRHGLLPKHYLAAEEQLHHHFQAYVDVYLTEEIRNEGIVRNLSGFARFLEVAGLTNAEMLNYSNIARDCGINRATVKEYYQILVDTLLGYYVYPYSEKIKRDIVTSSPKFYLFDIGIANYLGHNEVAILKGSVAGKSFEHYILMELMAYLKVLSKRQSIYYWRTKTGLEVDFILGQAEVALEVKLDQGVRRQDLRGLIAFCEEHPHAQAYVVSLAPKPRKIKVNNERSIEVLPWRAFIDRLWQGGII